MLDIKALGTRVLLWVVLPLVCVELLMIVLDPYLFKGFYQYDSEMGFQVRPYVPTSDGNLTNRFGFNDQDYALEKAPGTFRILIVGDSFSWAGGRESNYTKILERKLEDHYNGHKIDVINSGYPMTHSGEQLVMLKKYGMQYNPDMVILSFFVGNDFLDADPNRKRIVVNDIYVDIDKRKERRLFGYPIILRSRLFLFIQQKLKIFRETANGNIEGKAQSRQGTFTEDAFMNIEKARLDFFSLDAFRSKRFQPHIDSIFGAISEMDLLLKSRDVKFMVAILPDEFQVNKNLQRAIFERFNLRENDYDLNLAQDTLKAFLDAKGSHMWI